MQTTTEPTTAEIRRVMKHLSSLGASKGGRARAAKLSKRRRKEIAQRAARARWAKTQDNPQQG